jgi:hypothetical protein
MDRETRNWIVVVIFLLLLISIATIGAVLFMVYSNTKPTIEIAAPANGAELIQGQPVVIQSIARDPKGISLVELAVDNVIVKTDRLTTPINPATFAQSWQATTEGAHTISVRAYNANNAVTDFVSIKVKVVPQAKPTAIAPTPIPGTPTIPPPCVYNADFIGDVTVPDGTIFSAGQTYNKIWRVINNGSCPWNSGHQFVFVSGEQMTAATTVSVPFTPPGTTADLLVVMTAPSVPGPHAGRWHLRANDGTFYGPMLDVRINVPNPAPPPACTGTPSIASFTVSPTSISPHNVVTLQWGLVSNANAIRIDPGVGAVASPGKFDVVVDAPTTFVLTAFCGSTTTTAQVTVNLIQPTPAPTVIPPTPVPSFQVTGATASVNPSNFVGTCPGAFNYVGNITTNQPGTVTYRWTGSGSTSPSPVMTFYAPSAGAFALPVYQAQWGAKGNQSAQLQIVTPNSLTSNQASFTNSCADPKPAPPQSAILEPKDGFVGSTLAPVTIVFQGTGAEIKKISLYGNGQLLTSQSAPGTVSELRGTFEWHPAPGRVELYVIAEDASGQSTKSATVTGEIKAPAPAPTSVPPTPIPPTPTPPKDLSGAWKGGSFTINLQPMIGCLHLPCGYAGTVHDLRTGASGTLTQGSFDGTVLRVVFAFELPGTPSVTYTGSVSPDGSQLFGTWTDANGGSEHEVFRR